MRASTITTLIAALGLSVAGCTAMKDSGGGELRGTPDNIDVAHNTITMDGVTIQVASIRSPTSPRGRPTSSDTRSRAT